MFQYRQALVRVRQGDSDRQIAAARIMGRRTAARLRALGAQHKWRDAAGPMPQDEAIASALGQAKRASTTVSSLAAQRERIQGWAEQGVSGVAIFAALQREQGWVGSYSSVRRILADIVPPGLRPGRGSPSGLWRRPHAERPRVRSCNHAITPLVLVRPKSKSHSRQHRQKRRRRVTPAANPTNTMILIAACARRYWARGLKDHLNRRIPPQASRQAASVCAFSRRSAGTSSAHRAIACGQRVLNTQPEGGLIGDGKSP